MLADLPGLIEGAHEGVGLGDRFLGHAERCGAILHLVDGTDDAIAKTYKTIRAELEAYGHGLGDKPEIVALNKIDAIPKAAIAKKKARAGKSLRSRGPSPSPASPAPGVDTVLRALAKEVQKRRKPQAKPAKAVKSGEGEMDAMSGLLSNAKLVVVKVGSSCWSMAPAARFAATGWFRSAPTSRRCGARARKSFWFHPAPSRWDASCLKLPAGALRLEESQAAAAAGQVRLAQAYSDLLASENWSRRRFF